VIGAGAGGHAVASQLAKSHRFKPKDITMFDPNHLHYYQPSFTMVGGGVLGNM
jgi:sulfide:quinone oxidoreductase